jgi:hypothetical protein
MKQHNIDEVVKISSFGIDEKSCKFVQNSQQGELVAAHVQGEAILHAASSTVTSLLSTSFSTKFLQYDVPSILSEGKMRSMSGTSGGKRRCC